MLKKIISGGQPGAARAALDWAISHQLPYGGWCPRWRHMHDGVLDERYAELKESTLPIYSQAKEWNVRDSDGTLVFTLEENLDSFTRKTVDFARKHEKPCHHICGTGYESAEDLLHFINRNHIETLNIAGSHDSEELGIYIYVVDLLNEAFPQHLTKNQPHP
ncbi:MAG: putative molybdenum carrier protein [Verrucomicrobiota bacterium]